MSIFSNEKITGKKSGTTLRQKKKEKTGKREMKDLSILQEGEEREKRENYMEKTQKYYKKVPNSPPLATSLTRVP